MRFKTTLIATILITTGMAFALAPGASAGPVCPPQDHTDPTGMFHVTVDQWGCDVNIVVLEAADCLDPWHHSSGADFPPVTILIMPRCDTTPPPNGFLIEPAFNTVQTACSNALWPGACSLNASMNVCKDENQRDPTRQIHVHMDADDCELHITLLPMAHCAPPLRYSTYLDVLGVDHIHIPGCGVGIP